MSTLHRIIELAVEISDRDVEVEVSFTASIGYIELRIYHFSDNKCKSIVFLTSPYREHQYTDQELCNFLELIADHGFRQAEAAA